jgi:hypothetical protein
MHQILNENNNNFKNSNKKLKQKFENFQKQNQIKINNMVNMITLNPNVNNLNVSTNNQQANLNSNHLNGDLTLSCNSAFSIESSTENINNTQDASKVKTNPLNLSNKKAFQSKKSKPTLNSKRTLKVDLNDFSPLVINSKLGELSLESSEEISLNNTEENEKSESISKATYTNKKVNNNTNKVTNSPNLYTPSTSSQYFHKSPTHLNKQFNSVIDGRKLADKNSKQNGANKDKDFQLVASQITSPGNLNESTTVPTTQTQNSQSVDFSEINASSFNLNLPSVIPLPSSTRIMTNKSLFTKFTDANINNSNIKQLNQTSIKKIRELLRLDDFR